MAYQDPSLNSQWSAPASFQLPQLDQQLDPETGEPVNYVPANGAPPPMPGRLHAPYDPNVMPSEPMPQQPDTVPPMPGAVDAHALAGINSASAGNAPSYALPASASVQAQALTGKNSPDAGGPVSPGTDTGQGGIPEPPPRPSVVTDTHATPQQQNVVTQETNPYALRSQQADLRYHQAVNKALSVDENGNPLVDPKTGKPLPPASGVNPSWWRTVVALAAGFGKRGSAINNMGQALGNAIMTRDPRWQEAQQRLANVNLTHQEAEEARMQAQTAAMDAYRQSIILQKQMLAEQRKQEDEQKQHAADQTELARAVGHGFTPAQLPMTMPNPVSMTGMPSAVQTAVPNPATIETTVPEGRGNLPPGAHLPAGAPQGATPAVVAGQTGYMESPAELARQKMIATRNAEIATIGVTPPEEIGKAFTGIGDKILPREIPQLEAYLRARTQQSGGQQAVGQIMGKLWSAGIADGGAIADAGKALTAIQRGAQTHAITPEEAQVASGFYMTHSTPGSQEAAGIARMAQLAQTRGAVFLDSKDGNRPVMMNWNDINKSNQSDPGRFVPSGEGAKALKSTALMEDLRGGSAQVRNSLGRLTDQDFSVLSKADIALALRSSDPRSAVQSLITSGALSNLSNEQKDYVINLAVLKENAMAMRSVLGAGQGSEDLRSAIEATIPGASTPDRGFALKQLDAFGGVLDRLERGIPKVQLRNDIGPGASTGGGAVTVTDPRGHIHTFADQASADKFKKLANIP